MIVPKMVELETNIRNTLILILILNMISTRINTILTVSKKMIEIYPRTILVKMTSRMMFILPRNEGIEVEAEVGVQAEDMIVKTAEIIIQMIEFILNIVNQDLTHHHHPHPTGDVNSEQNIAVIVEEGVEIKLLKIKTQNIIVIVHPPLHLDLHRLRHLLLTDPLTGGGNIEVVILVAAHLRSIAMMIGVLVQDEMNISS